MGNSTEKHMPTYAFGSSEELEVMARDKTIETIRVIAMSGGKRCSPIVSLKLTMRLEERQAMLLETVGSTAVVSLICSSNIIVANCGDSRAVLWRGKEPMALSVDHKPNREDEYARIEAAGGKVIQWNGHRDGLWDVSDGLWDVMSNEEACDLARRRILLWHKKNGTVLPTDKGEGIDPAAQSAVEYLSNRALQKGSKDNITVIVIDLKSQRKFKTKPLKSQKAEEELKGWMDRALGENYPF